MHRLGKSSIEKLYQEGYWSRLNSAASAAAGFTGTVRRALITCRECGTWLEERASISQPAIVGIVSKQKPHTRICRVAPPPRIFCILHSEELPMIHRLQIPKKSKSSIGFQIRKDSKEVSARGPRWVAGGEVGVRPSAHLHRLTSMTKPCGIRTRTHPQSPRPTVETTLTQRRSGTPKSTGFEELQIRKDWRELSGWVAGGGGGGRGGRELDDGGARAFSHGTGAAHAPGRVPACQAGAVHPRHLIEYANTLLAFNQQYVTRLL